METRIEMVPIADKYALTIKEAAQYYNLGMNQLRDLCRIEDNDYSLRIGKKVLIKKDKFDKYLDGRKNL